MLGMVLFMLCISRLYHVIANHLPSAHGYADDTQLYLLFRPNGRSSQTWVKSWFDSNMSMAIHIGNICTKAFRGLDKIPQIRKHMHL